MEGLITMGEPKNKLKKIMVLIVTFFATLLSMYLAMSVYFMNRFYFGSSVNCINVSGKTIQEANKKLADEIATYTLVLEERGDLKEEIKSADIGLKYNPDAKLQSLKDSQNPFKWIYGVFNKTNFDLSEVASYDADLLKKSIDNLSCLNANNIIEHENASFKYSDNGYKIVEDIS